MSSNAVFFIVKQLKPVDTIHTIDEQKKYGSTYLALHHCIDRLVEDAHSFMVPYPTYNFY